MKKFILIILSTAVATTFNTYTAVADSSCPNVVKTVLEAARAVDAAFQTDTSTTVDLEKVSVIINNSDVEDCSPARLAQLKVALAELASKS